MSRLVFDIETVGYDMSVLEQLMPDDLREYSLDHVPYSYKSEKGITHWMEAHKAKWWDSRQKWIDGAALDATRARVAMVGFRRYGEHDIIEAVDNAAVDADSDERYILSTAWFNISRSLSYAEKVIGFNILGFDLPFMWRRSVILGVKVPSNIRRSWKHRVQWSDNFVDLMLEWNAGVYGDHISLNNLAKVLGIEGKSGSGADFATMSRDERVSYLKQDLDCCWNAADRLLGPAKSMVGVA